MISAVVKRRQRIRTALCTDSNLVEFYNVKSLNQRE